jgi:hypothetical protein
MPQRTIAEMMTGVYRHDFVLPAIQREFVWNRSQVCRLFDSIMRGYPIGTFLTWKVPAERVGDYVFYDFIRDYHQRDHPYCPSLKPDGGNPITAVLDGQQRLTALNVGLRGSHAEKLPRLWWNNPQAFPVKHLYLDLRGAGGEEELGLSYDFRFLATEEAEDGTTKNGAEWFKVSHVLNMEDQFGVIQYLQKLELANDPVVTKTLVKLYSVVHTDRLINYYEEESDDLDKVLNIFIRVNSSGTALSYSDLLLSVATAQWKELDARDAIRELVDELNKIGQGFNFSKDLVLKTGLVILDKGDIRFQLRNFDRDTMQQLESGWNQLRRKLLLAAELLHQFGFSRDNLAANSVLIPITYYLHHRDLDQSYLTNQHSAGDRTAARRWVLKSLLKTGVWGSSLDQLLVGLRKAIKEQGAGGWPTLAVEAEMSRRGKSLQFESAELDDLVRQEYGKRAYAVLATLYSLADTTTTVHVDHIFPHSRFTSARLSKAGFDRAEIAELADLAEQVCNLQLLPGPVNVQKQAMLPLDWLAQHYADDAQRNMWLTTYDAQGLPADIGDFRKFALQRRERMRKRLADILGVDLSHPAEVVAPTSETMDAVDEQAEMLTAQG